MHSSTAAKVKTPRVSTVSEDESEHHWEHEESEQDQFDMIDLSDPQDDIEILEHEEPMAFAVPPVMNELLNAPPTVSQMVQEPEATVLGIRGAEPQTPTSAIDRIEEHILS